MSLTTATDTLLVTVGDLKKIGQCWSGYKSNISYHSIMVNFVNFVVKLNFRKVKEPIKLALLECIVILTGLANLSPRY
jgi:hypothetical protein